MKNQPNPVKKHPIPSVHIGQAKDFFIENLAEMLDSGISITEALAALKQETRAKKLKQLISYIENEVDLGTPLWSIFDQLHLLPEYAISLVKIGERSGSLSKNMEIIAEQQRKEASLSSKLRAAMAYPILVFSLTLTVAIGISWFILPRFVVIFGNLRLTLPLTTRILLAVGQFLGHYGIIAVPSFLFFLILLSYFLFSNASTRWLGEKLLFQFSVSRQIIQQTQISRFTFLLGTLLKSGIPISVALYSVRQTTTNHYYHRLIRHIENRIQEGDSFQRAFASFSHSDRFIPATVQQMISAAEKTGKLPETFLRISDSFEDKIDNSAKTMAATLEPILLVMIWLGVVFVAVSIILPIYSLIGGLNNQTTTSVSPTPSAISVTPEPTITPSSLPTSSLSPVTEPTQPVE